MHATHTAQLSAARMPYAQRNLSAAQRMLTVAFTRQHSKQRRTAHHSSAKARQDSKPHAAHESVPSGSKG